MHHETLNGTKDIFNDLDLVNAKIYEYKDRPEIPRSKNNISDVMIFEPCTFPEMPKIVESIREYDVTILSMENMKENEFQRAIDFLSGSILAFDMKIELLEKKYYLITPDKSYVSSMKKHQNNYHHNLRKLAQLVPNQDKPSNTLFKAS
jgi:FtsZ-interacting cell division protein YlmF